MLLQYKGHTDQMTDVLWRLYRLQMPNKFFLITFQMFRPYFSLFSHFYCKESHFYYILDEYWSLPEWQLATWKKGFTQITSEDIYSERNIFWNHKLRLVFWPFRSRSTQCAGLLDDLQSYPQKVSETATDVSSDRVKYFGFRHHASIVRGYKEMNSCDLIYNRQFSSLPRPSEMNEKNVSTYDTKPCWKYEENPGSPLRSTG